MKHYKFDSQEDCEHYIRNLEKTIEYLEKKLDEVRKEDEEELKKDTIKALRKENW